MVKKQLYLAWMWLKRILWRSLPYTLTVSVLPGILINPGYLLWSWLFMYAQTCSMGFRSREYAGCLAIMQSLFLNHELTSLEVCIDELSCITSDHQYASHSAPCEYPWEYTTRSPYISHNYFVLPELAIDILFCIHNNILILFEIYFEMY